MTTEPEPTRDNEVQASREVLLEVMTVLGSEIDKMVVVGGWVPELLYPDCGHIGSLDVDVALDGRKIQPTAYDSIRQRLMAAGYTQQQGMPNVFYRDLEGRSIVVKVDFITGEGDVPASEVSQTLIQEMSVGKLKGTDLALDHTIEIEVEGPLPSGAKNKISVRIATVAAFICMKAFALNERKKEKDAYDIHFCLLHCEGGPQELAKAFIPLLGEPLVADAIEILKNKFSSIEMVGPQWAGQIAAEYGDDSETAARDAYERMSLLLSSIVENG